MRSNLFRRSIPVAVALLVVAVAGLFVSQVAGARSNVGAPVKAANVGHTITITGHGDVQATPDTATISLGVETRGQDAQAAVQENATKMTAVIAAVKTQGIPSGKIQTSNLSIYYDTDKDVYVVTNSVSVVVDTIANVGPVLDAAVAAGANNSWGIGWGLKNNSAAQNQALQSAITDAHQQATAIATGLGVTITGVGSASEADFNNPFKVAGAPEASAASSPVEAGQLDITADVQVVYTFG